MSIFNSMKCPRLFMYVFLLGYIRLPVFYFSTFLYIFFPFLSHLLSVYHCPLFISLVYCKLPFPFQNITLNIYFFSFYFLQALINPAWPPTPRSCTVGFGNVHLELFQLPWGPSALHKATQGLHAECLGVSLAFPRMKWHHSICWLCVFLAPSPLVSLLIQKERQKKWAAAVLCMKAIVGSSPPSLWSEVNITLFFLVAVDTFRKVRYKVQVEYSWGFSCIHSGWLSGIRSVNDNRKPFYITFLLTCSWIYEHLHYEKILRDPEFF